MHSFGLAFVPLETEKQAIRQVVHEMLWPYSQENLLPEPTIVWYSDRERKIMAKHFGVAANDFAALAGYVPEWEGGEQGGYGSNGVYHLTRSNPNGKFDYWVIGGNYSGEVAGTPQFDPLDRRKDYQALELNMLPASWLDHELSCRVLVTQEHGWQELDEPLDADESQKDASWEAWQKQIIRTIQEHQHCYIVGLYIHY